MKKQLALQVSHHTPTSLVVGMGSQGEAGRSTTVNVMQGVKRPTNKGIKNEVTDCENISQLMFVRNIPNGDCQRFTHSCLFYLSALKKYAATYLKIKD